MEAWLSEISQAVQDGNDKKTIELAREAIANGAAAVDILEKGLVSGVRALGQLFKDGQVYLPEILISTRAMNQGLNELRPYFTDAEIRNKGTVVLGTVEGDLHDIGKNLVGMMLSCNGFKVVDLGVDVSADNFVKASLENNANIVAMSGLLTTTITYFTIVVQALDRAGIRDKIKVMIGGASVTRDYANRIGVEGFAEDCVSAVDEAVNLMTV